jgi:hypothetical protein
MMLTSLAPLPPPEPQVFRNIKYAGARAKENGGS